MKSSNILRLILILKIELDLIHQSHYFSHLNKFNTLSENDSCKSKRISFFKFSVQFQFINYKFEL